MVEKTLKDLPSTFNARAETVASKPMFRAAFRRSRCVIPASGYYEWKLTPTGGSPLSFAGLWEEWKNAETGDSTKSCGIIVTGANELTRFTHDRIPVILNPVQFEPWLTGAVGTELLQSAPDDLLQMWPVSRRVNSSRAAGDDPAWIEPIQLDSGATPKP